MRLAPLALLAALAPACLSGLAEIRVQGADAGGADRPPPIDVVVDAAPRDAAGDRAQLADVADGSAAPETAVDAAPAVDLGVLEPDVVDAGSPDAGEDHPAPAEDATDAGVPEDAPAAVDAGECVSGCAAGEVCEGGRCGRWTYRGETRAFVADIQFTRDAAVVAARFDETCAMAIAGSRACRSPEVALDEGGRACGEGGALYFADLDVPPNTGVFSSRCLDCLADGGSPYLTLCTVTMNRLACCAFAPR